MKSMFGKIACLASVALLSACGGGGGDDAAAKKDSAVAEPATATSAAEPAAAAAPAADNTDTLDGTKLASMTGNAANGATVFTQCKACHVIDPGVNRIGPSLAGIVGRAAGSVSGFAYSAANKGSGITWSKEKLYQYLEKPQRVVPGTKMSFAGLPKAQDRADVIAYLADAAK